MTENNTNIGIINEIIDKNEKKAVAKILNQSYLNAKDNLTLAEPQYQVAKRNYLTYVSGTDGYEKIVSKEASANAKEISNQYKYLFVKLIREIKDKLNVFENLSNNYENTDYLFSQYNEENLIAKNKFNKLNNEAITNERRAFYENQGINFLNNFYDKILLSIYTLILVIYLYYWKKYDSPYNFKQKTYVFLAFLFLPFLSTWVLSLLVKIFHELFSLFPVNVYKSNDREIL